jgi:hypothetical protein
LADELGMQADANELKRLQTMGPTSHCYDERTLGEMYADTPHPDRR